MKKFKFYPDAGHGWLAVKRSFLIELGILNKISGYSYQRGGTVYLEEDCDATTFQKELEARGIEYEVVHPSNWPDHSPIRYYEYFEMASEERMAIEENDIKVLL
jgi:hypothetical protein